MAGEITGDYDGKATASVIFSDVSPTEFDVVSVIGGYGTNDHLWGNQKLQGFLKQAYNEKVLVTGICAGLLQLLKLVCFLEEKQLAIQ